MCTRSVCAIYGLYYTYITQMTSEEVAGQLEDLTMVCCLQIILLPHQINILHVYT